MLHVNGGVGQTRGETGFHGSSPGVAVCSSKSFILSGEAGVTMGVCGIVLSAGELVELNFALQ